MTTHYIPILLPHQNVCILYLPSAKRARRLFIEHGYWWKKFMPLKVNGQRLQFCWTASKWCRFERVFIAPLNWWLLRCKEGTEFLIQILAAWRWSIDFGAWISRWWRSSRKVRILCTAHFCPPTFLICGRTLREDAWRGLCWTLLLRLPLVFSAGFVVLP